MMNYLAHLLLAGEDPRWQLGGLLGDHVRGRDWQDYPDSVAAGILLHRALDQATDNHPVVRSARARLPSSHRRYGGIILDIFFDHLLARQWQQFHQQPLADFAENTYRLLKQERGRIPQSLVRLGDYLQRHNLLMNYADLDYLALVFNGVSKRVSRANPLAESAQLMIDDRSAWQADFEQLMPDLLTFAANYRPQAIARVNSSRDSP